MFVFLPLNLVLKGLYIVARRDPIRISWSAIDEVISPMSLWMDMVLINFAFSMQIMYHSGAKISAVS